MPLVSTLGLLGWALLIVLMVIVASRIRSLIRPQAFPPWMTPLLELGRNREKILDRAGFTAGERVLEVGPGGGWISEGIVERLGREGRLVCLDLQLPMLKKVRQRLGDRAALVCASGSELPFHDAVFDRAFLAHVLGEIPDKRGALSSLCRVIRTGGTLAIEEGIPDPDYISPPSLSRMAREAGFEPTERFGGWARYAWRFRRA
jgi:ubiquinone/menaquinone biosynthesis C-methylase UbiE